LKCCAGWRVAFKIEGDSYLQYSRIGLLGTYDVSNLYDPVNNPDGYQIGSFINHTGNQIASLASVLARPDLGMRSMPGLLAQQWGHKVVQRDPVCRHGTDPRTGLCLQPPPNNSTGNTK